MRDPHEPRDEFVEKLEWQIGLEARRRNRVAEVSGWTPWSRLKTTLAVVALMLVSMGIGAAAVATAYEAQDNERRDQLTSAFDQRLSLAQQRLVLATDGLHSAERQVSVGVAASSDVLDARVKVAEAEAQVKSIMSQLEEIRLTGRDPRSEMSAPRVGGRDFVGDRLRIDMSVPQAAMVFEQSRLEQARRRVSVGMADAAEIDAANLRVLELQAALETMRSKLDIRQRFLSGAVDSVETELRVLEAEAEQRKATLAPKLDLARKDMERVRTKVQVGEADRVQVTEADLHQLQLQVELMKADMDLALVRKQIDQHKKGK